MTRYRFQIPATVCFDVEADTPAEARKLADAVLVEAVDGLYVGWSDRMGDGRLYPDEDAVPEVVDVIEDDPADAT